jgi:hypothetical protein
MNGIQEALATRMVPRSNQLNYVTNFGNNPQWQFTNSLRNNTGNAPLPYFQFSQIFPYYSFAFNAPTGTATMVNSGRVHVDPNNFNSPVFGYYRYIVLGGDPARRASSGQYYWGTSTTDFNPPAQPAPPGARPYSQLVENEFFRQDGTPFIVVSHGMTCVRPNNANPGPALPQNGMVLTNAPNFNPNNPLAMPTCPAGTVVDQTTLVTQVTMDVRRADTRNTVPDTPDAIQVYKGNNFRIPAPATNPNGIQWVFAPGLGRISNNQFVNFESIWNPPNPQLNNNPARLSQIIFYNTATRQIVGRPIALFSTADQFNAAPPDSVRVFVNPGDNNPTINVLATGGFQIPPNTSIKLIFDGPIDYRSVYNYLVNGTVNRPANPLWGAAGPVNCLSDRQMCRMHLLAQAPTPNQQLDFNFLPLFPSHTQLLIAPTFEPNQFNTLRVSGMRNYAGQVDGPGNGRNYNILFRVNDDF